MLSYLFCENVVDLMYKTGYTRNKNNGKWFPAQSYLLTIKFEVMCNATVQTPGKCHFKIQRKDHPETAQGSLVLQNNLPFIS